MNQYTKGEWNFKTALEHLQDILATAEEHHNEKGDSTQTLYSMDIEAIKFLVANAHLMAAAPRMAQLLERLVNDGWNANISEEAKEILNTIP